MRKLVIAVVIAACSLLGLPSVADASTVHSCPRGAVCVYRGTTTASSIVYAFWSRGAHNIHNMYGNHLVVNNQTSGWTADAKSGYGGGGRTIFHFGAVKNRTRVLNLTPVNSMVLTPPRPSTPPGHPCGRRCN